VASQVPRMRWNWWLRIGITLIILTGLAAVGLVRWLLVDLPSPDRLYEHAAAPSTRIFDRNGRLLYEILDPHRGSHTPVALADVPAACVKATIATEDASFYQNPGVDLWAIARAVWINLWGGEVLSGGSTITQQVARNLLLLPEERAQISLERKLREAILAWRLARAYSKDEILTLYLNESYYGNLAYGIDAAARTYLAKNVGELDLAECALLAGLPQSPARYNPLQDPQAAQARQGVVLSLMVRNGSISQAEADMAAREKLGYASTPFPIEAPHWVMYVRGQLEQEFGLEALYTQGLQVYTTLDLDMQNTAQRIMRYRLEQLAEGSDGQPPRNVHNAAVVVMDPGTGEVLAMVGSPDYFDARIDGAVNATVATRQPGSSIKPITYAVALDPGRPNPLTAATMMVDTRTAFVTKEGDPYVPQNYDLQWRGPVLLRQALASSLNLIAVKVLDYVGLGPMTAQARALGITTFDDADRFGLALTLGGGEVRLLELTAAYAAFANQGYRVQPAIIRRVEDSHGRLLKTEADAPAVRAVDERVAYLITDILSDNMARLSGFGEGSPLHLTRPAAAKTGTTSDWRDNWTVGYTPDLVVGVWAGNADNEPMLHVTGVMGAAPIWHDIMEELLKGRPVRWFQEPPGMRHVVVCADSGLLPSGPAQPPSEGAAAPVSPVKHTPVPDGATRQLAPCPRTVDEIFIDGTQPTRTDDWHWWVRIDRRNDLLAGPDCPAQYATERLFTLYPAEAQDWVRRQAIPQPPGAYSPLCPAGERAPDDQRPADQSRHPDPYSLLPTPYSLTMTSPDQGSRFLLSPQIPKAMQRVAVAVRLADGVRVRQVVLLVDGQPLQTLTRPPYQAFWVMTPGRHVFSARATDEQGNEIEGNSVSIEVVE